MLLINEGADEMAKDSSCYFLSRCEKLQIPDLVARNDTHGLLAYHNELKEHRQLIRSNVRILRILRLLYRSICAEFHLEQLNHEQFSQIFLQLLKHLLFNFDHTALEDVVTQQWHMVAYGSESIEFDGFCQAWFTFSEQWIKTISVLDSEHFLLFAKRIILGDTDPSSFKALKVAIGITDGDGSSLVTVEEYLHCIESRQLQEKLNIVLGISHSFDPHAFIKYHGAFVTMPMYPATLCRREDPNDSLYIRQELSEKHIRPVVSKVDGPRKLLQRGLVTQAYFYDDQDQSQGETDAMIVGKPQLLTDWTYRSFAPGQTIIKQRTRIKPSRRRTPPPPPKQSTMQKRLHDLRCGYLKPRK